MRVPLIPGFNADDASLTAIADFVMSLGRPVASLDLLPYHTLGKAKYGALGRDYPWEGRPRLAETEIERLANVVTARVAPAEITVRIGG